MSRSSSRVHLDSSFSIAGDAMLVESERVYEHALEQRNARKKGAEVLASFF